MGTDCLGASGMRIATAQCTTCIFRPGNKMHLEQGRLATMIATVRATESYVICHDSLDLSPRQQVICHGSFTRIKTRIIQLAERMGFIEWVDPHTLKGTDV